MTVLAQHLASQDGYAAGPDGEQETFAHVPAGGDTPADEHNVRLLELVVAPVILGTGRRLVHVDVPITLRLTGEVWPTGTTRLRYAVTSQSAVDITRTVVDAS